MDAMCYTTAELEKLHLELYDILREILRVFDNLKYTLSNKESSTGKYTSVSIDCFVLDADQVINIYKKVATIEGVMML